MTRASEKLIIHSKNFNKNFFSKASLHSKVP